MSLIQHDFVWNSNMGILSNGQYSLSPNIRAFLNGLDEGSSGVDMTRCRKYSDGSTMRLIAGNRSGAEQLKLFKQGRSCKYKDYKNRVTHIGASKEPQFWINKNTTTVTDKSKIVTRAFPGQSYHQYGLAVDICFRSIGIPDNPKDEISVSNHKEEGQFVSTSSVMTLKQFYEEIGLLAWAKKCGLRWGGEWNDFPDLAHFEDTHYSIPLNPTLTDADGYVANPWWSELNFHFPQIVEYNRTGLSDTASGGTKLNSFKTGFWVAIVGVTAGFIYGKKKGWF